MLINKDKFFRNTEYTKYYDYKFDSYSKPKQIINILNKIMREYMYALV